MIPEHNIKLICSLYKTVAIEKKNLHLSLALLWTQHANGSQYSDKAVMPESFPFQVEQLKVKNKRINPFVHDTK